MATNFVKEGDILTFTAPTGGVVSGTAYLIGGILCVAMATVAETLEFEGRVAGVFTLPKANSQAWTEGQKIYWDDSAKVCTNVATAGQLIGVAAAEVAVTLGLITGQVRLNGGAPSALEGPQAAEIDLVDNSGGAAADGTIAVVTAPTALTDNGGGTADATVLAMTIPAALTWHADIENAAANAALVQSSAVNPTKAEFDELAHELGLKVNALNALALVMKDNFKEVTTRQGENRAAIVALTDAVKELSTKQNALLAKLRIAGIIA